MQYRLVAAALSVVAIALTGCATNQVPASAPTTAETTTASPTPTSTPSDVIASGSDDGEARAQAQAWLDDITLPPAAASTTSSVAAFNTYYGWPCGPVAELEAFWLVPDSTVGDTAGWLDEHPAGDLISVWGDHGPDLSDATGGALGFVPEEGAQEGIVFTLLETTDGVAVRAEIAAQTADASCPELPDGAQYGAPGMG